MLLNESPDNKEIKLQIEVGEQQVYNDKLNYDKNKNAYLGVKTDFPIGKYTIFASVDSLVKIHPIMVDADRLVFITYTFNSLDTIIETIPFKGDSVTIKRTADLKDAKLDIEITLDTGP